jgi:hypothetical protein
MNCCEMDDCYSSIKTTFLFHMNTNEYKNLMTVNQRVVGSSPTGRAKSFTFSEAFFIPLFFREFGNS